LTPVLYVVQELTVRLGIVSGKGHAALIKENFGRAWAWISVATLVVACIGALLSELSGLAGVGLLFGVPTSLTMTLTVTALIFLAYKGSYFSVERTAIAIGAFELVFVIVAWRAKPDLAVLVSSSISVPWHETKYLYLVAANIGAVIMPWMIFYQQSAVAEKNLKSHDLASARWDTAFGAVVTQIIMVAVLVATAATLGGSDAVGSLDTVQEIAQAITPYLGTETGKLLFALGLSGAAIVATIVVTLTAARTVSEVLGVKHHLEYGPHKAPWFYGIYALTLTVGAGVVISGINLVNLSVGVQVMNALLLPIVLTLLFLLARRLPGSHRLQGAYAFAVAAVIGVTVIFGIYSGLSGLFD
jgi:Mn2+/Fe2+ NRAMP family transporter